MRANLRGEALTLRDREVLPAAGSTRVNVPSVMDQVVVFVDAGYLFAQGSKELCGAKLPRGSIGLDHTILIPMLTEFAEGLSG